MVFREFLFFFALVLTTYDALQNAPPKVSEAPAAAPFFRRGSLVADWYGGSLSEAFPRILAHELSFVMYYAPWDAESRHARREFDRAAQIMHGRVHFAAVDCWRPGGECRAHHVHISAWPVLILHTNLWRTIVYDGPKDYRSMVKFLNEAFLPFEYLTSNGSLHELAASCDAVVLGFIPMDSDPLSYNVFYNVALKRLEHDPFRDVRFGVITSEKLAVEMGVENIPSIRLLLWNDTLEYPISMPFNEENISNWLYAKIHRQAAWLIPSWRKSVKLQGLFERHPVLLLFTPRNVFHDRTPSYDLLREIALEYNNCMNDSHIESITATMRNQRRKYADHNRRKKEICRDFSNLLNKSKSVKTHRSHTIKNVWLNGTSCSKDVFNENVRFFTLNEGSYLHNGASENIFDSKLDCDANDEQYCSAEPEMFSNVPHTYDLIEMVASNNRNFDEFETSQLNTIDDPKSSVNLLKRHLKRLCARIELAQNGEAQAIPKFNDKIISVQGLRCQTNDSLYFVAIDSILSPHFAESLGIDIENKSDKTAVVILDNKRESQYVMRESIGEKSLREFVRNYTTNVLRRNLRTPVKNSNYNHYYGSDRSFKNVHFSNNNASSSVKNADPLCQTLKNDKIICIKELNTSTFQSFINQRDKALLVVFCGKGPGACGGVLTVVLLSLVRTLSELGNQFEVAKIDASINDLPWEYTVSKYPTLMFFPSIRKEDSRVYPENRQVTIEGVLAFVLSGFETPIRLHSQVLLCNNTMDEHGAKRCLSNVRRSVVDLIGATLGHWRRSADPSARNVLVRRLQSLRSLAMALGALNTTKVPASHPTYAAFSASVRALASIWRKTAIALSRQHHHHHQRQPPPIDYDKLL